MKKTLIFVSILAVMFLVSSCAKTEPQLSKPKSSIGGGSGGPNQQTYLYEITNTDNLDFINSSNITFTNAKATVFEASMVGGNIGNLGFSLGNGIITNKVYIIWSEDSRGDWWRLAYEDAGEFILVDYPPEEYFKIVVPGSSRKSAVVEWKPEFGSISVYGNDLLPEHEVSIQMIAPGQCAYSGFDEFGYYADAEATDLFIFDFESGSWTGYMGFYDYDLALTDDFVIEHPEANFDSDKVKFRITA